VSVTRARSLGKAKSYALKYGVDGLTYQKERQTTKWPTPTAEEAVHGKNNDKERQ